MKAVFLDRDGVINVYPGNFKYVTSVDEFRFLPGVKPALKKLTAAGYKIFVISNQAGVAKGIYTKATLDLITAKMLNELKIEGVEIDDVYYCTHHSDENCACRKPKAGLVHMALDKLKKNKQITAITESYFIGDAERDIETGKAVGLKTILVFSGREKPENRSNWKSLPDYTAKDLQEAVEIIISNDKAQMTKNLEF